MGLLTVFGYSGHQLKTRLDVSAGRMRYLLDLDRALSSVSRATVTAQQTTGDRTQVLSQVRKSLEGMRAASEDPLATSSGTRHSVHLTASSLPITEFMSETERWLLNPGSTTDTVTALARRLSDAIYAAQSETFEVRTQLQAQSILFGDLLAAAATAFVFVMAMCVVRPVRSAYLSAVKRNRTLSGQCDLLQEQTDHWSELLANSETKLANIDKELNERMQEALDTAEKLQLTLDHAQQATEIARFSASRFQELFQGIPVPAFTFDPQGTIYEWNRAASSLYQKEGFAVFQQPIYGAVFPENEWPLIRNIVQRVYAGETITNIEREEKRITGESVWILASFFPLRNPLDEVVGAVCASVDITERKITEQQLLAYQSQIKDQMSYITEQNLLLQSKQAELEAMNAKLHSLATTDGLTGLQNHRTFQEELENKFNAARTKEKPISLLLLDVDFFKRFNDEFGHQAGDDVLKGVAQILRETSQKGETPARYGGEEFAIILPGKTEEQALAAAERFRKAIESQPWPNRQVTTSIGVATMIPVGEERAALIQRADEALYESKRRGRNQSTHHNDIGGEVRAA